MKTCHYDNNLENLLPLSQVLVCMGSPLSPDSTQTQEFIDKSQQKSESLALVRTLPHPCVSKLLLLLSGSEQGSPC